MVDESSIKSGIVSLMEAAFTDNAADQSMSDETKSAIDKHAGDLAKVIADAIKSGTVQSGIAVSVDPNTGAGSTTGTGEIQ